MQRYDYYLIFKEENFIFVVGVVYVPRRFTISA